MKEKKLIIGPFEAKNKIGLLAFDSDKLYLISLDFKSLLKYSIGIQLPFFTKHFDRLKSKRISELINQYKTVELKYSDLKDLRVKRSNLFISIEKYTTISFQKYTIFYFN